MHVDKIDDATFSKSIFVFITKEPIFLSTLNDAVHRTPSHPEERSNFRAGVLAAGV